MRALTILTAACLMIGMGVAPTATAHTLSETGTLLVGTAVTAWVDVGITWTLAQCDTSSPFNGVDGMFYDVQGYGGHNFLLTTSDPMDLDLLTFTADCELIEFNGACFVETGLGELDPLGDCSTETGVIEPEAAFALVLNFAGAGTYNFQITH